MHNDVESMCFGRDKDLFFEGKEEFGRILLKLILVDAGAEYIDFPVCDRRVNSARIPAVVGLTPVGANQVNATEDNFIIVLIDDITTLSVERGNDRVDIIFMSMVVYKQVNIRRKFLVTKIEERAKN